MHLFATTTPELSESFRLVLEKKVRPAVSRLMPLADAAYFPGGGNSVTFVSPGGLNGIPATDPAKLDAAYRSGELVMDLGTSGSHRIDIPE